MFVSKIATFASLALFAAVATGCAAAAEPAASSDEALVAEGRADAFVFDGSFKLYDELTAVDPMCDVHTILDLQAKGGKLTASLRDAVDGVCKILLDETARTYVLKLDRTDCGSMIYKGLGEVDGEQRTIEIVDHRTRICRDVVPASIVVTEGVPSAEPRTMFSSDGPGIIGF